jgi:sugar lactone lactonase YvrE
MQGSKSVLILGPCAGFMSVAFSNARWVFMRILVLREIRWLCLLGMAAVVLAGGSVRADMLFVSNAGANAIQRFSTDGGAGTLFADTGLNNPQGLAFDVAGNLYVDNFLDGTITKFTAGGVGSTFATGLSFPTGMAFDDAGALFVSNGGAFNITHFPAGGGSSTFAPFSGSPYGMAFDNGGNLYVANFSGSTIRRFTPGGTASVFADTGLSQPAGLAFDSVGNLYVANNLNNTIARFTPDGVGSVFASTGMNKPVGLAFDGAGNLYVANSGDGTIEMFTPAGAGSLFASGLSSPTFLVIVPEPGTVLLAVVGMVGFLGRRRNP